MVAARVGRVMTDIIKAAPAHERSECELQRVNPGQTLSWAGDRAVVQITVVVCITSVSKSSAQRLVGSGSNS